MTPAEEDIDPETRRARGRAPEGSREVVVVEALDADLQALVAAAHAAMPRGGHDKAIVRAGWLAQWVVTRCGGPLTPDRAAKAQSLLRGLLAGGGPLGVVPLAKVTQGLTRHRALLFKLLCDFLLGEEARLRPLASG